MRKKQSSYLARRLSCRGKDLCDRGKFSEAITNYEKAIAIYARLVERKGCKDLAKELARSFRNRGTVLYLMEKFPEAIADYDRSLAQHPRLVEEDGLRSELADLLRITLHNRAKLLLQQGEQDDRATSDLKNVLAVTQ